MCTCRVYTPPAGRQPGALDIQPQRPPLPPTAPFTHKQQHLKRRQRRLLTGHAPPSWWHRAAGPRPRCRGAAAGGGWPAGEGGHVSAGGRGVSRAARQGRGFLQLRRAANNKARRCRTSQQSSSAARRVAAALQLASTAGASTLHCSLSAGPPTARSAPHLHVSHHRAADEAVPDGHLRGSITTPAGAGSADARCTGRHLAWCNIRRFGPVPHAAAVPVWA